MMRSSSKMITRARSVRNVGKVPFKFKFDFIVETVDKLAASGDVVVVWERSSTKTVATKAVKIDKTTRKADFGSDRIECELTMYKSHPSDKKFLDKVFKVAVRSNGADGKTLGKIHLNLGEYVEVPAGTKRICAELTNGSTIVASIQCQFVSMGKTGGKGGVKGELSDSDGADEAAGAAMGLGCPEDGPANFLKNRLKLGRVGSRKAIAGRKGRGDDAGADAAMGAASPDQVSLERLRKENARLRKQLEEGRAGAGAGAGADGAAGQTDKGGGGGAASAENARLKKEVVDLKNAIAREPVYADVVRELKEAKMGLALLHVEKERIDGELARRKQGKKKINGRSKRRSK